MATNPCAERRYQGEDDTEHERPDRHVHEHAEKHLVPTWRVVGITRRRVRRKVRPDSHRNEEPVGPSQNTNASPFARTLTARAASAMRRFMSARRLTSAIGLASSSLLWALATMAFVIERRGHRIEELTPQDNPSTENRPSPSQGNIINGSVGKLVYVHSVPWVRIPPRPSPRNEFRARAGRCTPMLLRRFSGESAGDGPSSYGLSCRARRVRRRWRRLLPRRDDSVDVRSPCRSC